MLQSLIDFVRDHYRTNDFIPLHAPVFGGNEKAYVGETIDSTFVSSVGAFVDRLERDMAIYTGSPRAVATVNGTAALHVALRLVDVGPGDYVITQPLTFVATCNAIAYCGAMPIFVDVDRHTLGLSPAALAGWLEAHAYRDDNGHCRRREDDGVIRACLPMHTFGHPADLDGLVRVCHDWGLALVEDAAESLGSTYHGQHTGTFGTLGTLSFNGNKVITTGGGGMILADATLGERAKHLTTTAKQPHAYEYVHDELGYNYRLPNLNAALGCAQLEQLDVFIAEKRQLAADYAACLADSELTFVTEPEGCRSNYWLNAVLCPDRQRRDHLLQVTNKQGIMTRPIWQLMNRLPMYANAPTGELPNALWLEARVVNLPSGTRAAPGIVDA
ncbi:LegC family aminotransferase [Halomonas daqingensis]|uniref:LegC family aminotransferase n=1 Tax=Billgrantia desiderata TaxID=52021 RepID=UPI001F35B185|nr:LegC family aminotransferase [Halomonas desiderata]MCE8027078.1 LegC family aminotransferase [Halomonas desiderata]